MATVGQIVEDAFNDLEVKVAEVDLTPSEMSLGIRYLNRLMVSFASSGLNLGYSKAEAETELFTSPDWAEDMVITHLAIRLAPGFGVTVTPALVGTAQEMMKVVVKRLTELPVVNYPNSLPIGSGNWQEDNTYYFHDDTLGDLYGGNNQQLDDDEAVDLSVD